MRKVTILLCAIAMLLGAAGGASAACGVDHAGGTTTPAPERPPVQM